MHPELEKKLRDAGMVVTQPRLLIYAALHEHRGPESAEQLYQRTDVADLVTVYRALHLFSQKGLVRAVRFKDSTTRYELATIEHHHHIVCTVCGLVEELADCLLPDVHASIASKAEKFAYVDEHSLEFYGTCTSCAR